MAKKHYTLVGVDSHALSIVGYVIKAMKAEHKSSEEISAYQKKALSGDYHNVIRVSVEMCDELNDN